MPHPHPPTSHHRRHLTHGRVLLSAVVSGVLATAGLVALSATAPARQMETLDRRVTSLHTDSGNLVSWRWLATAQVIAGIDWVTKNAVEPAMAGMSLGSLVNSQPMPRAMPSPPA